jgi:hypothetical protein
MRSIGKSVLSAGSGATSDDPRSVSTLPLNALVLPSNRRIPDALT